MKSSILIPTYNQKPEYLVAAVRSAMNQTADSFEVIVIDDGSEPPSDLVLGNHFSGDEPNPLFVYAQDNGGVASALNAGLAQARGDYIHWLSSDDLFHRDKVRIQVERMEESGDVVSYCGYEDGIPVAQNIYPAAQYPTKEKLLSHLQKHSFINACTVCWHRSVFEKTGGWKEELIHAQDVEMIIHCAFFWNFLAVNSPLVRRRIHPGQMLNTLMDDEEFEKKKKDIQYMKEQYGVEFEAWRPTAGP